MDGEFQLLVGLNGAGGAHRSGRGGRGVHQRLPWCGGDRNLYVNRVRASGQTVQAESGGVRYDRGQAEAAFDGPNVIAGQEGCVGALRWDSGGGLSRRHR
jgi:hypothetical protein